MVSVVSDTVRRLLVAALKLSTMVPVAEPERSVIVPVPRAMASEKVSAMLAPTATPVRPSEGVKVETVGAVLSTVLMFVTAVVLLSVAASLPAMSCTAALVVAALLVGAV